DSLQQAGLMALGTVTGAGGLPCDDSLRPLLGHPIALWPDFDEVGLKHMHKIAASLKRLGAAPRMIRWTEARNEGDDAADYLARGGTAEGVRELTEKAEEPKAGQEAAGSNESGPGCMFQPGQVVRTKARRVAKVVAVTENTADVRVLGAAEVEVVPLDSLRP